MKNIINIISNGEGLTVEFKKSREKVTSDVYQSICAFLNRKGGQVFLGVEDDGTITGIKGLLVRQTRIYLSGCFAFWKR